MEWTYILTITCIFLGITYILIDIQVGMGGLNKRIDDLKESFNIKLDARIKPIEMALNNHITETDRKIDALDAKVTKILEKLDK